MNNEFYVYGYYRLDTNSYFYIGKGKGKRCKSKQGRSNHFLNIINSVPYEIRILYDNLSEEEAYMYEEITIDQLIEEGYSIEIKGYEKKEKNLVNRCRGGLGGLANIPKSEETKQKLSESRKGKCTGNDNPNSRKVILLNTLEVFDTISEASKKYNVMTSEISRVCSKQRHYAGKLNDEKMVWMYIEDYENITYDDIINAVKDIYIEDKVGENNPFYGKYHTEETKRKIRESKLGEKNSNYGNHNTYNSRKVRCVELDETYDSVKEAVRQINSKYGLSLNYTSINQRLNGTSNRDWYGELEIDGEIIKLHWELAV